MLPRRSLSDPGEIAYSLAHAPVGIEIDELARIASIGWAIEECFQTAKNERGLDEYEVRCYPGWYRHITLAMLAHAAQATVEAVKGAAETHQPSSRSPGQRSGGSWTLSCLTHAPGTTASRAALHVGAGGLPPTPSAFPGG